MTSKRKREKQKKIRHLKKINKKQEECFQSNTSLLKSCLFFLNSFKPLFVGVFFGVSAVFVVSSILVQNFMYFSMTVAEGMEFIEYSKSTELFDETSEFSTLTTDANIDTSNNIIQLEHQGDNPPNIANGDWWDDDANVNTDYNWNYRRCFDVNNTGSFLPDYQIYLDFPTNGYISSGQMDSNGDDIRFVDENGNDLDYYILDEINTDRTKAWVKLQDLAGNSTTKVCMYWGNPTAIAKSDRIDTFSYPTTRANYYVMDDQIQNSPISIGSYLDGNNISAGINSQIIDEYKFSTTSTESLQSLGILTNAPIQPNWEGNGTESLVPASAAGTSFVYEAQRGTNEYSISSPFCTPTIDLTGFNGASNYPLTGSPLTLSQGQSFNFLTDNNLGTGLPNNSVIIIESTCPILVSHHAINTDGYVLFPAANEWIGTGTSSIEIAALQNGTNFTLYRSNGTSNSYSLNRGQTISVNDAGSQGSEPAQYVKSNLPVGVKSIADGDGNESTTFLPIKELSTRFTIPQDSQYVAVAGLPNENITGNIYYNGAQCGVGAPDLTQSATSSNINTPTKLYFGTTSNGNNIPAGSCLVLSSPGHVIAEPFSTNDEMNLWGEKQNREYLPNLPVTYSSSQSGTWRLGLNPPLRWRSRQIFTVTNSTSQALTEVPVFLPLENYSPGTLFGQVQADGGDIRAGGLLGDGTDSYPYSIDQFDGNINSAKMWVQIPSIPANGSVQFAIYYRYSSQPITTTSNQNNVFSYSTLKPTYYFVDKVGVLSNDLFLWGQTSTAQVEFDSNPYTVQPGLSQQLSIGGVLSGFYSFGDKISSNGPINGDSMIDVTDTISPEAYLGKEFVTYAYRNVDEFNLLSPFSNASVDIYRGVGGNWVFVQNISLVQNTALSQTINIPDGEGIKITSNNPIIVNHRAETVDSKTLFPVQNSFVESTGQYELFGLTSGVGYITASQDNTTVTYYLDNGSASTSVINEGDTISINGPSNNISGAIKVVADKPISGMSAADSDGTESVIYLPKQEFNTTYIYPQESQYIVVVSDSDILSCQLFDVNGVLLNSFTTTNNGANFPNMLYFGDQNFTTPFYPSRVRMECNKPFYSIYEKQDDLNIVSDETNVLTYNQARKGVLSPPTVQSIRSLTIQNEGLYLQPGIVNYLIDLNSLPNSQFTSWKTFQWLENILANTDITVEVASNNSNPCSTVGLTYQTLNTNTVNNLSLANGSCFYLQITLNSDDRQYTPTIDDLYIEYYTSTPIPLGNNIVINLDHNTSGINEKILEIKSNNTSLAGKDAYLIYKGGVNDSNFSSFNIDLYDTNSFISYNQFASVPTPGDTGLSSAIQSNNIGMEIDYQSINTTPSTLNFTYVIKLGNPSSYITHDLTINFN